MSAFPHIRRRLMRLAKHDFLPGANRYLRWMATPLGGLLLAAASALACGLFVAPQGLVFFAALAGIVVMGIIWPWVGLRGVSGELRFSTDRAREGDVVPVRVVLINRWPWPVWGLTIAGGFHLQAKGLPGYPPENDETAVSLARLGGWSRSEFEWEFRPECRGAYPIEPPRVATQFPFGLWKSDRPLKVAESIVVWPRVIPLSNLTLPAGEQRWTTAASPFKNGDVGERQEVRPYRAGDSLRNVRWNLSARFDRWIVSDRQGTSQARARVSVDVDRATHTSGPRGSFECAVRTAASVCAALVEQGTLVVCELGEQQIELLPQDASLRHFLDQLATFDSPVQLPRTGGRRAFRRGPPRLAVRRTREASEFRVYIASDRAATDEMAGSERRLIRILADGRGVGHDSPAWIELEQDLDPSAKLASEWRWRANEVWRGR